MLHQSTGTKSVKYLEENWAAREVSFSAEELEEIKAVLDQAHVGGQRYSEAYMRMVDL
jgi:hypothetical protein